MNTWRVMTGDVRERLAELPDASARCCVTSPPYWGLRDYGVSGQLGLENTPDEFVAAMVNVFRDVRRVLSDDGTLWLNLGDSYAGSGPSGASYQSDTTKRRAGQSTDGAFRISKTLKTRGLSYAEKKPVPPVGLKSKDLVGIPWRVAFALQADGWYLRSDIIWSKPNPMPESVTDRPTKAHEYIFLLSKSKSYYYDAAAIREPYAASTLREFADGYEGKARKDYSGTGAQNASDVKRRIVDKQRGHGRRHAGFNDRGDARKSDREGENGRNVQTTNSEAERRDQVGTFNNNPRLRPDMGGANKRSVWHVATHPYPDAHFATYPESLIEPCILAGSAFGDTVLDPFTGSGTTGAVAIRHQRNFIGTELNPVYVELARKRISSVAPMFAQEVA